MKKTYSKPLFDEKNIYSNTGIADIKVDYEDIVKEALSNFSEKLPDNFYE